MLAPQRPHLGRALELDGDLPRHAARRCLAAEAADEAAGELGVGGDARGGVASGLLDLVVLVGGPRESELDGALAAHLFAEEAHRGGGLAAGGAVQQGQVAAAGVEADLDEARQEPGTRRDDAQVGGQGEVEPCAHGGAAHGGDRRQLDRADRREGRVDGLEVAVGGVLDGVAADVGEDLAHGTCAEVAAAGDDDRADLGVGLGRARSVDELAGHLHGQGIAPVRCVERDRPDVLGDGVLDLGHGISFV